MSSEKHAPDSPSSSKENHTLARGHTGDTAVGSQALPFAPHTAEPSKVLEALGVNPKAGLTDEEAASRLAKYGPNRIKPPKAPSLWGICLRQIGNAMTVVLSE